MPSIYIQVGQSIQSRTGNYYKILQFLGNGANAFAYRCLCTSGYNRGIEFVLKLQYNLSTEMRRERFLRESEFLKSCNHPAILVQYDFGTFETAHQSYPFIVTSFMPDTLQRRLAGEQITFESKIKYSCQLLSAVAFLESQNIVHRDIKPSNIFISNDNVVLGDFGLIKKIEPEQQAIIDDDIALVNETVMSTFEGYVAMAKYYRTPELVNYANRVDYLHIETDVFQLGLVLTELFTGMNPLEPSLNLRAPIVLNDIGYITAPHHGRTIRQTLSEMLIIDYRNRISVQLALDRFSGIYAI